jgi:hypothetical protein
MSYFSFTFRMKWIEKQKLIDHMNKYWSPLEYCMTQEYSSYDYKQKSPMLCTGEHIHLYFKSRVRLNTCRKTWLTQNKHNEPPPLVLLAKEYNKGRGGNHFKKFQEHKETDKDKDKYILGYILKQRPTNKDGTVCLSPEYIEDCIKYHNEYNIKRSKKLGIKLYDKCIEAYVVGKTKHENYDILYNLVAKYRYDNKQGFDIHQTNKIIYAILYENDEQFKKKSLECSRRTFFYKTTSTNQAS